MSTVGWTRTRVAAELGVTPRTLYNWEREGKVPTPGRDMRGWRRYTDEQVAALRRRVSPAGSAVGVAHPRSPDFDHSMREGTRMELSARNNLRGTVKAIKMDTITAEVVLDLGHDLEIVSIITRDSVERLGLKVGDPAIAVIKSTEVLIGK